MIIKDYFYTQERFEIEESNYSGVLKTINSPENLDKYYESEKYLSHKKNKSILSKVYTHIQGLNEKYKLKIIQKYVPQGTLLDYGCGDGSFIEFMKKNNFSTLGIEPNKKAAKIASKKVGAETILNSLKEMEPNKADIITLWHVLEHIPNPEEIIAEIKLKLAKNGHLIIALPNHHSYDAKFYKNEWAAWDVPRHLFHYSKEGAINFFRNNDFNVVHTYPLPFDSFFVSMLSEKYKKNPFGLIRFPIIGAISNFKGMKSGNFSSVIYVLNT